MDQELANDKINKWGMLLLLNVPSEMHFGFICSPNICFIIFDTGMDNTFWKIGSKFKGVKLIPPGSHFVYYSLKDEKFQFKLSFFLNISDKKRVYVKKWDAEAEDFLELPAEEEKSYESALKNYEFDRYLGAYPLEKHEIWLEVANYITSTVLDRLFSKETKIYQSKKEYKQENPTAPKQEIEEFMELGGSINYTDIPKRKFNHGVSGQNLTKMNFDKSTILKEMLAKEFSGDYKLLLGEFQVAFVSFLMGESLDSFNQWKNIFILLTSCDELMTANQDLFIDFIPVLYNQLKQFPVDFFHDTISSNNFMKTCLKNFLEIGLNDASNSKLRNRCKKIELMMKEYFKFSIDLIENGYDENDEDLPVVVENFDFIKL